MPFGPPTTQLTIFETMPALSEATFNSGVPCKATDSDSLSIILFSPNLQIIASMDNSQSEATSGYEVAISQGFTFDTTQSLSISASVGASIEIVSAKVTTTFALSFTEEWTTTTTKTMNFSCPPGKKAFVYQGTLMSRILEFQAGPAQYQWYSDTAKALTQVLVTTAAPIGQAPSNPVSISGT